MSTEPNESNAFADARSPEDRRLDESVSALFREAGMAVSNGYAPEILGSDARARAGEEASLGAIFQDATCLQTGAEPDFRRMAQNARRLARERAAGPIEDEELVGELTRSALKQLPDLEVHCWNVSQAARMPVETALSGAAAAAPALLAGSGGAAGAPAGGAKVAAPAAVRMATPASGSAALAPAADGLTAVDAANIRENNWVEFKRRYHSEHRRHVLQMALAGAVGAAACFVAVWSAGLFSAAGGNPTERTVAELPPPIPPGPTPWGDSQAAQPGLVRTVDQPAGGLDEHYLPVDPAGLMDPSKPWLQKGSTEMGLPFPGDLPEMPSFVPVRPRGSDQALRALVHDSAQPAGDNVPPELYPDAGRGLRVIRMSPRSDFAQAGLDVNDWITRVIPPKGEEIDLGSGSSNAFDQWQRFYRAQRPGNKFDVEYERGPLIQRTTLTLSGDGTSH
ncbi:MAG: hypothetical protein ACREJ2_14750 [Planctomycetota bacterium]